MLKSRTKWQLPQIVDEKEIATLATENQVSPFLIKLLSNRQINTTEKIQPFLNPETQPLHDPFLMHDMEKAVARIHQGIEEGENILVYGDYDADGITSTTVLLETLETLGANASFYLPNRFIDGYGPNVAAFEKAIEAGVSLIVTVDNGVAGHEAIARAGELGVDVIVTDHHELPAELPAAFAIVHPAHPEGAYPFKQLAGVGVAFKLATALLDEVPEEMLDLVAIGTVADLVSLTDENRTLVAKGLRLLKDTERIGLHALCQVAGIDQESLTEESIGFGLSPRLNAVGRLGDASPGVKLLSTFDPEEAALLAKEIDTINKKRQEIVETITQEALALVAEQAEHAVLVLEKAGWHEGVLGIVASKIVSETGKPAVVLTRDPDKGLLKGSARSVGAFNLYKALNEKRTLFTHFGGHHMAAGMSFPIENLAAVQTQLDDYAKAHFSATDLMSETQIDEVLTIPEATLGFIQELNQLAPFGTDNPKPILLFKEVNYTDMKKIGANKNHLKCQLVMEDASLDVVGFGIGEVVDQVSATAKLSVIGKLGINEWQGNKKPQLLLEDIAIEGTQIFDCRKSHVANEIWANNDTHFVVFSRKVYKKEVPNMVDDARISIISTLEDAQQFVTAEQSLTFIDCPPTLELMTAVLEGNQPENIYACFINPDEAYLNGMPSRENFMTLFKFFSQYQNIDVRYKINALAQAIKLKENLLIFMIHVFFEAGFVTIDDGILNIVEAPDKKELTEMPSYEKRIKKMEAERLLVYSNYQDLVAWFQQL
ncbi:single-stranded-DNA-specific exonuclease RecJ [Isobaculum melis]|uniref:Single-stranded-DNA-specific exonuclease RecJ n=1 Tax=Isobaculum melis TaxID=142588 RepID=A0A1H9RT15_9LACT|nr:single-stranded-DNA-specific exonuclease RecJ [Isobaculum melis]SER75932.1 exonuclease RecJ [Isobaculum melis]